MITAQTIKSIAQSISTSTADVTIAGGALRDIDHGLAPKDVDIFVNIRSVQDADQFLDFIDTISNMDYRGEEEHGEYNVQLNNIHSVYNYTLEQDKPIQIIFVEFPNEFPQATWTESVLNIFDLNICKISAKYRTQDDKVVVSKHDDYKLGKRDRIVRNTLIPTPQLQHKTSERSARISRKLNYGESLDFGGLGNRNRAVPVELPRLMDEYLRFNEAQIFNWDRFMATGNILTTTVTVPNNLNGYIRTRG